MKDNDNDTDEVNDNDNRNDDKLCQWQAYWY